MATQVQIRGATETTQEARTLTSRELDINTTDNRICVHNGSTTGGVPHINYADYQNQEYVYGAASGTDAITVDMAKAPSAYQTGQRFTFKAANTNTGSATININSLGAKTLKKKDVGSGSLVTLDAGDIIQNAIYTVFYDGTDMILDVSTGSSPIKIVGSSSGAGPISTIDFLNVLSSNKIYKAIVSREGDGTTTTNNLQFSLSTDGGSNWLGYSDCGPSGTGLAGSHSTVLEILNIDGVYPTSYTWRGVSKDGTHGTGGAIYGTGLYDSISFRISNDLSVNYQIVIYEYDIS